MDLSVRSLFRDAGRGFRVAGWYAREALRDPFGPNSTHARGWFLPPFAAIFAFSPIVAATRGRMQWVQAISTFIGIGLLAVVLLALLARRFAREHPEV